MSTLVSEKYRIKRLQHILKTEFILSLNLDEKYITFLQKCLENSSFLDFYLEEKEDGDFVNNVVKEEIKTYDIVPSEEEINLNLGSFITINSFK